MTDGHTDKYDKHTNKYSLQAVKQIRHTERHKETEMLAHRKTNTTYTQKDIQKQRRTDRQIRQ
jgi:hypothetical protein